MTASDTFLGFEALRNLKVLEGPLPGFDSDAVPDEPLALFDQWLRFAIEHGVAEPHAMTLATVDNRGTPDARVVLLKRYDTHGWYFASGARSTKGRQIAARPAACLTFYWPAVGRQIRIAGFAVDLGPELSAADFLARSTGSRAVALSGRQSETGATQAAIDASFISACKQIERDPGSIAPDWTAYRVEPERVEFWQGAEDRRHRRLLYTRSDQSWARDRLWP